MTEGGHNSVHYKEILRDIGYQEFYEILGIEKALYEDERIRPFTACNDLYSAG